MNVNKKLLQDPLIVKAIKNIARSIVEEATKIKKGQKVLIWFEPLGTPLVEELKKQCQVKGAEVKLFKDDLEKDTKIIPTLTPEKIKHYLDEEEALVHEAEVIIRVAGAEDPEALKSLPVHLLTVYKERALQIYQQSVKEKDIRTLFYWPTVYEAEREKLSYDEYFRIVVNSCDQPWEEIKKAQEKLVEKLNQGENLELLANTDDPEPKKRTHVRMSIEGMTFCNSTIKKNYPGSEVFSAPVLESVNGQIFAPGEYLLNFKLMKNLFFVIKKGKIVEAYAEEGDEGLQEILSEGAGARYFGEIGFGTNPGLTRDFFNPLLNEKVCGSFHLAIGHCYEFTKHEGRSVKVNNGNTKDKTPIHWDLTILMHRRANGKGGGKVVLDGEVIQEDGRFCDPALAILNPAEISISSG